MSEWVTYQNMSKIASKANLVPRAFFENAKKGPGNEVAQKQIYI
jgi:hypothetical protein